MKQVCLFDYRIEYRLASATEWTVQNDDVSTGSAGVVDGNGAGLTSGEDYAFRVAAITEIAESGERVVGAYSEVTVAAEGLPAATTGLTSSPNADGTLGVSWTAPSDGGSAITGYVLQISLSNPANSQDSWESYTEGVSSAPAATLDKATDARLDPGRNVWVRVQAVNEYGAGDFSVASPRLTMPDVPSGSLAVTELTPADQAVTIKWSYDQVANSSEAPVTKFVVTRRVAGQSGFGSQVEIAATAPLELLVPQLTNGTEYEFEIVAKNVNGTGASIITTAVTPRTNPLAPTSLAGQAGDRRVMLTWDPPADTGGTPVIDYEIRYRQNGDQIWQQFNDGVRSGTGATVTGLTNGLDYEFEVQAITAVEGVSATVGPIRPLALSAAPGSVVASVPAGESGTVDLEWTAPMLTGGATISGYAIQYSKDSGNNWFEPSGQVSVFVAGETARVTGLTNGLAYTFRVAGVTAAGTGLFSARTSLVVPVSSAPAPVIGSVVAQSDKITLFFADPLSGYGGTVADYEVEWRPAGITTAQKSFTGGNAWFTASGLDSGTDYEFRVRARLATGVFGEWTNPWRTESTAD